MYYEIEKEVSRNLDHSKYVSRNESCIFRDYYERQASERNAT